MAQERVPDQKGIEERVRALVSQNLQVSEDEVEPDSNFVYDLGADSLDLTELAAALEEEFEIEIPEAEFARIMSVSRVVSYVESQVG